MQKLYEIEDVIKSVAEAQPNIDLVFKGDIYQLNTKPDTTYPCVCITQNQHREDDEFRYYGLYLYYVDRLLEDKSNQLEIQSQGIEALSNIINTLQSMDIDVEDNTDITYVPFYQSFADLCAGVYAQVTLMVPISACEDLYDIIKAFWTNNQDLTITQNGQYEAGAGYTGLGTITVNVSGGSAETQEKTVNLTSETTATVTPDSGKVLSKVTVDATTLATNKINEGKAAQKAEDDAKLTDSQTITQNGIYKADFGFKQVIVNISGTTTENVIDYTKIDDKYVSIPKIEEGYDMLFAVECTEDGKLLLGDGDEDYQTFKIYSYKSSIDCTYVQNDDDAYLSGDFEKDKYYPVWVNLNDNTTLREHFCDEAYIHSAVIPASVTALGKYVLRAQELELITCYATTAPTLGTKALSGNHETGVLRVPAGATGYDAWLSVLGSGWTIEYMDNIITPSVDTSLIYYKSTDNKPINFTQDYNSSSEIKHYYGASDGLYNADGKCLSVIYSTYENGQGIIGVNGIVAKLYGLIDNHGADVYPDLWRHRLSEFKIPDTVTTLNERVFEYCTNLTSITVPSSVTSVSEYWLANSSITTIKMEGTTAPTLTDGTTFQYTQNTGTVYYPKGADYSTWQNAFRYDNWTFVEY